MATEQEIITFQNGLQRHIDLVREGIGKLVIELIERGKVHDQSKLEEPELSSYAEHIPLVAKTEFGTPEHAKAVYKMKDAVAHHRQNNPHHVEFHENGIRGMSLIDMLEMLCDWNARAKEDGKTAYDSIDTCSLEYQIPIELADILKNTVKYITQEEE